MGVPGAKRWPWHFASFATSNARCPPSLAGRAPDVREVLILAGEASGDLHAAGLATALRTLRPELKLVGMGGGNMERAGVQLIERTDALGVMGFVVVLRQIPHHWALLREIRRRLQRGEVGVLVV